MRRQWMCCSLALGLVACNADAEFTDGLPTAEQVQIKVPGQTGMSSKSEDGLGDQHSALVGTTSELYQVTWGVSASINVGTAAIVGLLRLITLQAPTSRTADSRTWGPHAGGGLDPMTYKMIVRKLGTLHYGFSLEASSKLAADPTQFLPLIDGEITRGTQIGTGHGTMVVHFDNNRVLRPDACEDGTLAFDFDTTGGTARNDVTLHAFANANAKNILCKQEKPIDAAYHFDQDTAGAGNFTFQVVKDMLGTAAEESVTIRSRWKATGAGRSDIVIEGAEVAAALTANGLSGPVVGSQCWDDRYQTVYEAANPIQLEIFVGGGTASACAFSTAELPQ